MLETIEFNIKFPRKEYGMRSEDSASGSSNMSPPSRGGDHIQQRQKDTG